MSGENKNRRDFLVKLGIGAGGVGIGTQAAASRRSLLPNVSYDAPTTVKVGLPADFPDGMKFLPEQRLFVFREGKVFHAVSAVCTHLGCSPTLRLGDSALNAELQAPGGFFCPCHGSRFDLAGRVVKNVPAPTNLDIPAYRFIDADRLQSGLTAAQAARDPDGRITAVISARDPGIGNWVQTDGLRDLLPMIRWQGLPAEPVGQGPMHALNIVSFAQLDAHLPTGIARITPTQRAAQIAERRVAWTRRITE